MMYSELKSKLDDIRANRESFTRGDLQGAVEALTMTAYPDLPRYRRVLLEDAFADYVDANEPQEELDAALAALIEKWS